MRQQLFCVIMIYLPIRSECAFELSIQSLTMNNSVIDVIQINLNQFSGDPEILPGAGEDAVNTVSRKIVKVIKKALIVLHLT